MDKGAIITGLVTFTAALLLWRKTMVERTDSQIQKEHMLYQLRELQRLSSALSSSPSFSSFSFEDQGMFLAFESRITDILAELVEKKDG